MHSPPAEPLSHPKRAAQALYHIFTSSPISKCFKKPIFKAKGHSNTSQHFETPELPEHKEKPQVPFPQKKTEESGLKQAAGEGSSEIKGEPHNLATVTTPPSCESELPPADNPDEEDEDQTVFFTPELFEGEVEESTPHKEAKTESPPRMVLGPESPVLLSEELFRSEQASVFDGQGAISVSKESAELSQGQREVRGQTQGEEGEQVENQSRQTGSRLCRLSRSRQKAPLTPTGN